MMNNILMGVLSGAIGGVILQAIFEYFKNQKEYIREQIDNLYGPIYFCIIRSKANFAHAQSIAKASGEFFDYEKSARDPGSQARLKKSVENTLSIENEYAEAGFSINNEIFAIISSKYSYIDPDDMDVFARYIKNFERINIEIKKKLKLELSIYKQLGDIQGLSADFSARIEKKFLNKKDRLQSLAIEPEKAR